MKGLFKFAIAAIAALLISISASAQKNGVQQVLPATEDEIGLSQAEEFPEFDPEIAAENGYEVETDEAGGYKVKGSASMITGSIIDLLLHFLLNLLISWIIVQFFYFRKGGQRNYYFTFLIFSSAMFLLLYVMNNLSLQIGFTLGLFAIFGMIRYRTETVPVREMTYLFIIIAISIINGIGAEIPYAIIATANVVMVLLIWLLEGIGIIRSRVSTKVILYDRIELVEASRRAELKEDLEKRLGLKIESIEVGMVDFLKDSAYLKVTYELPKGEASSIDKAIKIKTYEG